MPLNVHVMEIN